MKRETAIRASMMGMLSGLGVHMFSFNVKRKYGQCESCGNPTRDERWCFKCKEKHPEPTPDILIIHPTKRYEARNYHPPFQTLTGHVEINGQPFTEKL